MIEIQNICLDAVNSKDGGSIRQLLVCKGWLMMLRYLLAPQHHTTALPQLISCPGSLTSQSLIKTNFPNKPRRRVLGQSLARQGHRSSQQLSIPRPAPRPAPSTWTLS